jgi:ABC-2 type transport system permease protein
MRFLMIFIVPVAFATTVPAEALTGHLTTETLLGAGLLAAVMLVASRIFWKIGLRRYSGASA